MLWPKHSFIPSPFHNLLLWVKIKEVRGSDFNEMYERNPRNIRSCLIDLLSHDWTGSGEGRGRG